MTTLVYIPTIFGVSIEVYFILIFLGVPTFIIWRWILKKFIKNNKSRKIATWIATIFLTPMIYAGLIALLIILINYYPSHKFDKIKWFVEKEKRYEMSEDIINSRMLIGRTKVEVQQILGYEGNTNQSDDWYYDLGFKPGLFNIDPDVLEVEFKFGKVVKVGQHET